MKAKTLSILTHRALRIAIGVALLLLAIFSMLRATQMSVSLLVVMLFAIVNIMHIICDKFWSWMFVMLYFVGYIILLWIAYFGDCHLVGVKYEVAEYIATGGLFVVITIIAIAVCYLLKPPHRTQ